MSAVAIADVSAWISTLPPTCARKPESWPPQTDRPFDWDRPSDEQYSDPDVIADWGENADVGDDEGSKTRKRPASPSPDAFAPSFAASRVKLDYGYHRPPARGRQELQDHILGKIRGASDGAASSSSSTAKGRPWIVFTAGPMGVGKGYALTMLHRSGLFPLDSFLKIDPDLIKNELPEMAGYLVRDPGSAATKLHRESGQMADILFEYALLGEREGESRDPAAEGPPPSVLVDGSLRDVGWHTHLFDRIHAHPSGFRVAILQITADQSTIRERARIRGEKTGRFVPDEILQESMDQVPRSVEALMEKADAVHTVANDEGRPLRLVRSFWGGMEREVPVTDQDEGAEEWSGAWKEFARSWRTDDNEEESEEETDGEMKAEEVEEALEAEACPPPVATSRICRRRGGFSINLADLTSNTEGAWTDSEAHRAASDIWQVAFPNFCARCELTCGEQCGVCIHGRHKCACKLCGGKGGDCGGGAACGGS
mmetsp:Transcript_20443/g.43845  ORF Transcript_20443/g.43845 Transcript_20443/m.43845 type:complete len:485 (-) Transcript_20443:379-1833(-)